MAEDGDRDGIPNVILEAMACGVPVISTSTSGIPEVITHQYNGLLVKEKNSFELAEAIEKLYYNYEECIFLSKNARKTIEDKFDSNHTNKLLKKLLESL